MKKILTFTLIIIIVIVSIFAYKYFQNRNKDLNKIENTSLTQVSSKRDENYFLLYIDEISKDDVNVLVNGTISRGNIKINDEISIVGLGKKEVTTTVSKIYINNEEVNEAHEGDNIRLVLLESDIFTDYIIQGQAVIKTGTTKPVYNIEIILDTISIDNISELENKVDTASVNTDIKCSIKVLSEEKNEIKITLDVPIVIDDGIEISLKNGDKVIAKGVAINT